MYTKCQMQDRKNNDTYQFSANLFEIVNSIYVYFYGLLTYFLVF